MGSFLMTGEERERGDGKRVDERSFTCLEAEDT